MTWSSFRWTKGSCLRLRAPLLLACGFLRILFSENFVPMVDGAHTSLCRIFFFLSVKLIVFCDGFSTPRPPSPNKAVNQRTSTSKDARLDILANRPSRIRFTCGKPYPLKTSECSVPCALRAEQRARDAQLRRWKGLLAAAFRTGIHQAQSSRIVRCPSLAHPHHC